MCVIWYLGYNRNAHTNHESSRDHEFTSHVVTNHEITRGAERGPRSEEMKNLIILRYQNEDLKITFDQSKKGGGS